MTETFCDSGAVKLKSGAAVSTAITGANYTQFINQAECFINSAMRIDFIPLFAGLSADVKSILEDAAACHAATAAITYDLDQYSSMIQAQTLLDLNWARLMEDIKLLKEKEVTTFLKNA
jgi:hypothetical protein